MKRLSLSAFAHPEWTATERDNLPSRTFTASLRRGNTNPSRWDSSLEMLDCSSTSSHSSDVSGVGGRSRSATAHGNPIGSSIQDAGFLGPFFVMEFSATPRHRLLSGRVFGSTKYPASKRVAENSITKN